MSTEVQFRLMGSSNDVLRVLDELKGMDGIEAADEVADLAAEMRPDSSSAGLPDDRGARLHHVNVDIVEGASVAHMRDELEDLAVRNDLVIEFVDPI